MPMGYDWKVLTQVINEAPATPTFLDKLIKNEQTIPLPKISLRKDSFTLTASPLRAPFGSWTATAPSWTSTETEITPPEIREAREVTEQFLFAKNYNPYVIEATTGNIASSIDYVIAQATRQMKEAIQMRIELMLADLLEDGAIGYNDGTYEYQLSFPVTSKNVTLSATTDVMRMLHKEIQAMLKAGVVPDAIIISEDVADALYSNEDVKQYLYRQMIGSGDIVMEKVAYGSSFVKLPNLPPIYEYHVQIGSEEYFASGKMVILDTSKVVKYFAAVINANLDSAMRPVMGKVLAFEYTPPEGNKTEIVAISRPVPVILQADAVRVLNVTIG